MNKAWRIAHLLKLRGGVWKRLGHIFELINFVIYSNHISANIQIGKKTRFEHHGLGCVVHENAIIGENCKIFQNVTIGARWPSNCSDDGVPIIGNNVQIGCGAALLGKIHIGDGAVIGANAVVITDIPNNTLAVGVPAECKRK